MRVAALEAQSLAQPGLLVVVLDALELQLANGKAPGLVVEHLLLLLPDAVSAASTLEATRGEGDDRWWYHAQGVHIEHMVSTESDGDSE
jgi:hypothetical protein